MPPYNQLRSKLDRACVAFLKTASAYGPVANIAVPIYPANWSGDQDLTMGAWVDVKAHHGRPTVDGFAGADTFYVQFGIEAAAANQMGQVTAAQQRVLIDQVTGQVLDALSLSFDNGQNLDGTARGITTAGRLLATTGSAQDQLDNADMVNFTCQYWYITGPKEGGRPREEGGGPTSTNWKELCTFMAVCSAANVS